MSNAEFQELDEESLQRFVSLGVPEGLYVDYKREISAQLSKSSKKEFLKDISGFSNANGGMIVYGCNEPNDHMTAEQQLVGLSDDTQGLASILERVASSSLDPRIPGLDFRTIALGNGKHAIVVYIPPSNLKPHMVVADGSNRFHIRHSESTQPMTTAEVRSSVISAYNRSDEIESMRREILNRHADTNPGKVAVFIIQAIPLTEPSISWAVFTDKIQRVFGNRERYDDFRHWSLHSSDYPKIDVCERYCKGDFNKNAHGSFLRGRWKLGARENGHVYVYSEVFPFTHANDLDVDANQPYFSGWQNQLFCAFGSVVDELQNAFGTAHGYQIFCELLNAHNVIVYPDTGVGARYTEPLDRENLQWPNIVCTSGQSVESACQSMGEIVFQASGQLPAPSVLKKRGDLG